MRVRWMILVLATAVLGLLGTAWGQWNPDTPKLFEAVGDSAGSRLGIGVAGIGDQNGDGYDDIIAGAIRDRKVYLYYGGSPMDAVPDMVFKGVGNDAIYTSCLSYAGDVNGDGVGDFMAGAYSPYPGEPSKVLGKVYVYLGGSLLDTIPDVMLIGEDPNDCFGCELSQAGDVNGDGYGDVIVSATNYPNETMQGKVYIFFGGPDMDSIPDWTVVGDTDHFYLGMQVSGGGDINGDGYDDVAIGGCRTTQSEPWTSCYFRLYYGGQEMDTVADFMVEGNPYLPYSVSCNATVIGDVNGDGYADVACGTWHYDSTGYPEGDAYIFYGGQQVDTIPDVILWGKGDWYGCSGPLSAAGDVNGDGYADVIIGDDWGFGGFGAVLIYLGGRNMDGKLDVGFQGLYSSYPGCGKSVGRAGDVNGDGVDDILFGAEGLYDPDEYSEGRVVIFPGSWSYVREEGEGVRLPREVSLGQNWPNPFNAETIINYQLSIINSAHTTLKVYNILGEEVRTLVDRRQRAGSYRVVWDGRDGRGREVGSGIYFYRLEVKGDRCKVVRTRKMVLIR